MTVRAVWAIWAADVLEVEARLRGHRDGLAWWDDEGAWVPYHVLVSAAPVVRPLA
jgi:hypothetical protein